MIPACLSRRVPRDDNGFRANTRACEPDTVVVTTRKTSLQRATRADILDLVPVGWNPSCCEKQIEIGPLGELSPHWSADDDVGENLGRNVRKHRATGTHLVNISGAAVA